MTGVYTRSYTNYRDGCQVGESKLTSSFVQKNGVRILNTLYLDDPRGTEGQVLFAPNILMRDGLRHDLVLAADMSGNVYAWDLWSGYVMWRQRIATPVIISKNQDMYLINPLWSICSTGVVDPDTGIWYLVALSSLDGSIAKSQYYFHALSLQDGSATAPPLPMNGMTGYGKTLGSTYRKQRAALTLLNKQGRKYVYVPFGSFAESAATNNGFVVAIDVTNAPAFDALWVTGQKYPGAGIWMAGAGLSVTDDGDLLGMTGNGGFDPPESVGECIFKLHHTPGNLTVSDWFSPYSDSGRAGGDPTAPMPGVNAPGDMDMMMGPMATNTVNSGPTNVRKVGDQDLGSGGPLFLSRAVFGLTQNTIWGAGKDGILYAVNADVMGKTMPPDFAPGKIGNNYAKLLCPPYGFTWYPGNLNLAPVNLDELPWNNDGYTHHVHGQPVAYISSDHGALAYVQGENSPVRAFKILGNGVPQYLACGQENASQGMAAPGGMPGGMMSLSCTQYGDNTGVLWSEMPWYGDANKTITPGRLVAYGANWVDQNGHLIKIFDSATLNWKYMHNKFNPPTCTGYGQVLLPTYDGRILVLG